MQSRVDTDHDQYDRHKHRPQLEIEHIDVEVGVHSRHHGGQKQRMQQVPAHAVVLPHALCLFDSAKHARDPPHGEPDRILQRQHDARCDAQVAMYGVEVAGGALLDLVGLDEQDAGGEERKGEQVEGGVVARADELFLGGPGRLEDQNGFGEGEHAGGLEERVWAKERDEGRVAKDRGPDEGCEQDAASLGEPAGPCGGGGGVRDGVLVILTS